MDSTVLFTHLKIILLQCFSVFSFQFSIFSFQFLAVSKQTLNLENHPWFPSDKLLAVTEFQALN